MNLTKDELSLIAYACSEMAFKRMAQANDAESQHSDIGKEIAEANRSEAKRYFTISQKCGDQE